MAWVILVLFALKLFFVSFTVCFPQTSLFAAVNKSTIISLTNQGRQEQGLGALKENSKLNSAAYLKAQDMIEDDYFAHTSPDGISPWYWFSRAGYDYEYAGENLAMDFVDSTELYNAWYSSPSHRDNIINPNYEEIGVAVVTGEYEGRETTMVVQLFGSQAGSAQPAPETTTPETTTETEPETATETETTTTETTTETTEAPAEETYEPENEGSLTAYYIDKGEEFPSFKERAKLFEKYGLGPASSYQGTEEQNDMLLGALLEADKNKKKKPKESKLTNLEDKLTEKEIALLEEALSRESQDPVFSLRTEIKGAEAGKESGFWFYTASLMTNYYDNITKKIFLAVLLMVVFSLALDIFIKIKNQSRDLIFRGVLYSFVLLALFLLDKELIVELIPHNLGIL